MPQQQEFQDISRGTRVASAAAMTSRSLVICLSIAGSLASQSDAWAALELYKSVRHAGGASTPLALHGMLREGSLGIRDMGALGPALRAQIARMKKMAKRDNVIAADGAWFNPHFGNGAALESPRSSYSQLVLGVWDRGTHTFRGLHRTESGELVAVTVRGSDPVEIVIKDGASPLIGAARHKAKYDRRGVTMLRSWYREQRPAGSRQAALAEQAGASAADSVAEEIQYRKGKPARTRVHVVADARGGMLDAGPDEYGGLAYEYHRDAHTGATLLVHNRPLDLYERFALREGKPVRNPRTTELTPGQDPWQGD
jgi:hypothetical protein